MSNDAESEIVPSQSDEHIGKGVECVELVTADQTELSEFNTRVSPLQGKLSVLVHPFYGVVSLPGSLDEHKFVTQDYIERRDQFLTAILKNDVPFVVFEPETTFTELPTNLGKYGNGKAYVVKTERSKHMPIGGEETWDRFIHILKDARIDHVVLGGMFLTTYKSEIAPYFDSSDIFRNFVRDMPALAEKYPRAARWLKEDLAPIGCVGHAAIHFLNSGIDVSLSSVATPTSGKGYFPMKLVPNDEDF